MQRLATSGAHSPGLLKQPDAKISEKFEPEVHIIGKIPYFSPKRVLRITTNLLRRTISERGKLRRNGWYRRIRKEILHPKAPTNSSSTTPFSSHFRSGQRRLPKRINFDQKSPQGHGSPSKFRIATPASWRNPWRHHVPCEQVTWS